MQHNRFARLREVMPRIAILIVDDHAGVRSCIRSMMELRSDWTIYGEACDGIEAIEKATALKPDPVLTDLSMPRLGGLEATRVIRQEIPATTVLVISQNDPVIAARQAIQAGAWGYVSKATLGTDLIPAVDRFSRGSRGSDPGATGARDSKVL